MEMFIHGDQIGMDSSDWLELILKKYSNLTNCIFLMEFKWKISLVVKNIQLFWPMMEKSILGGMEMMDNLETKTELTSLSHNY